MNASILVILSLLTPLYGADTRVSYSRFLEHVRSGEVTSVTVRAQSGAAPVTAKLRDGRRVQSALPADFRTELTLMLEQKVDIDFVPSSGPSLFNAVPVVLLAALWCLLLWWMRRGRHGLPQISRM